MKDREEKLEGGKKRKTAGELEKEEKVLEGFIGGIDKGKKKRREEGEKGSQISRE